MKKFYTLLMAVSVVFAAFAASMSGTSKSKKFNANTVMIPIGNSGTTISLKELSTISQADLEQLTGRSMTFGEKLAFKKTQRKLSRSIAEDGTITSFKFNYLAQQQSEGLISSVVGLLLGLFLSLVGVLIAYLIGGDNKKSRTTWAWIGFAISLIVWGAILI